MIPCTEPSPRKRGIQTLVLGCATALLLLTTSCSGGGEKGKAGKPAASAGGGAASAPRVFVIEAGRQAVPIVNTYPAQTLASESVQLRPRVEGYLLNFSFREGSLVNQGQLLFEIDPAPFQAALEQALASRSRAVASQDAAQADISRANADLAYARKQVDYVRACAQLTTAEATLKKATEDVNRYRPLAKAQAIPQQTLDYALAALSQAQADVTAAKATVTNSKLKTEADITRAQSAVGTAQANLAAARAGLQAADAEVTRARLNLSYTHIIAPIRGMIGKVNVTPGNLVGRGEPTLLATIDGLDPIYATFSISEVDWLRYSGAEAKRMPKELQFEMLLADGSRYPQRGRFGMSARALESQTGTLTIRTVFPNSGLRLRPNQFVRVRVITEVQPEALMVPQRAVMEFQALQTVFVVDPDNKVARRTITLGERVDNAFIVQSGLKPGDRVIVEGLQKVQPGASVIPEVVPLDLKRDGAPASKASASPAEGGATEASPAATDPSGTPAGGR